MKRKLVIALTVALGCASIWQANAQIMTNSLPVGEELPQSWTDAGLLDPTPQKWSASISYAVTQAPTGGIYTYWYKVQHLGAGPFSGPIQSIDSAGVDFSANRLLNVNGVYQFGQYQDKNILSWFAEPLLQEEDNLRWSNYSRTMGSKLAAGETIYLWAQSTHGPSSLRYLSLQAGSVGQAGVIAPVPEPGSILVLSSGLLGAVAMFRKRR